MSQWTHIQAFSKEADWLCRWMKPRWVVAFCTCSATCAAGAAEPHLNSSCFSVLHGLVYQTNRYQQTGATSRGYSGIGGAWMEMEARQPLGEREQSMGWSHLSLYPWVNLPKSTDLWKQPDIISRPTRALLQSHFSPQTSSKFPEVYGGPWGWWAVRGGPWEMSSWQAGLVGCTLSNNLALWSLHGEARRLLLAWQAALNTLKDPVIILLKALLGFWRLAVWQ